MFVRIISRYMRAGVLMNFCRLLIFNALYRWKKTAENRRKPQKTAKYRRKPQKTSTPKMWVCTFAVFNNKNGIFDMKICHFSGADYSTYESAKAFKPVTSLVLRVKCVDKTKRWADYVHPDIRVRLVDGARGSSHEVVPQMSCDTLSDIAAKTEGYQRRLGWAADMSAPNNVRLSGANQYTIVLNSLAAVDLSNDKYLDIDLFNCKAGFHYELFGLEHPEISQFVRTIKKFYLSGGEMEKGFSVQDNELLALPLSQIKEIQFFSKNGLTSPVFSSVELALLEDQSNDIQNLAVNEFNQLVVTNGHTDLKHDTQTGFMIVVGSFGFDKWALVDLTPYSRFEVRREEGTEALMFFMIDSAPTSPTSDAAAAGSLSIPTANVNKAQEIAEKVLTGKN